jgi:hypothetical protein
VYECIRRDVYKGRPMKTYPSYFLVYKCMGGSKWELSAQFLYQDDAENWGQDLNRRGFEAKVTRIDR